MLEGLFALLAGLAVAGLAIGLAVLVLGLIFHAVALPLALGAWILKLLAGLFVGLLLLVGALVAAALALPFLLLPLVVLAPPLLVIWLLVRRGRRPAGA